MPRTIEGKLSGRNKKIGIVVSRFNEFITKELLKACLSELKRLGVADKNITVAYVPGSYELPVAATAMAKRKNIQGVVCLGAVIRGETYHFELVAQGAARGVTQAALMTGKPVIFGVLTTETVDQAYKRSESKGDNKGRDAAESVVEMIDVLRQIKRAS